MSAGLSSFHTVFTDTVLLHPSKTKYFPTTETVLSQGQEAMDHRLFQATWPGHISISFWKGWLSCWLLRAGTLSGPWIMKHGSVPPRIRWTVKWIPDFRDILRSAHWLGYAPQPPLTWEPLLQPSAFQDQYLLIWRQSRHLSHGAIHGQGNKF